MKPLQHHSSTLPPVKRPHLLSLLVIVCTLLGAALPLRAQEPAEYVLDIGEFTKIKLSDRVNVVYRTTPDSVGMISYRAHPRHAEAYSFTVKKGTLRVHLEQEWEDSMPTVYVYSTFLSEVENEGEGSLTVCSPAPCPEFSAKMIGNGFIIVDNINATSVSASLMAGNGKIIMTGSTTDASATMMGAGRIDLSYLSATNVSCKSIGAGSISCWARKKLSVKGIGSTKIYYRGNPEISKFGGAKILPASEMPKEN